MSIDQIDFTLSLCIPNECCHVRIEAMITSENQALYFSGMLGFSFFASPLFCIYPLLRHEDLGLLVNPGGLFILSLLSIYFFKGKI